MNNAWVRGDIIHSDSMIQNISFKNVAEVLPDSQCGFRRGRGCVDMIFCARQMIEKAVEGNTKIFMLFIDLQKAYDSVPCQALWHVLESYGIPKSMLQIIRSLHDGMKLK